MVAQFTTGKGENARNRKISAGLHKLYSFGVGKKSRLTEELKAKSRGEENI
jgi:hypothetical protein